MSVCRGKLKDVYIIGVRKWFDEPYFYCRCGGIGPICSDCKRNHHNTGFETNDITTWYSPNVWGDGTVCLDYIKISDK